MKDGGGKKGGWKKGKQGRRGGESNWSIHSENFLAKGYPNVNYNEIVPHYTSLDTVIWLPQCPNINHHHCNNNK